MSSALDRLDAALASLDDEAVAELDRQIEDELRKPWLPTPGPQLEAYLSEADLLLYGGAAGGGKTDLLCGLALTEHKRTVIFRRQAKDLDGFWERLTKIVPDAPQRDANKKKMVTFDDRMIECGHLDAPGSELSWQGRPHDLIGFDEGAQLSAFKVKFVLGWLRSADVKHCRAVIASNPPIGGEGAWLIEWFAPWLDPLFPSPAQYGDLRWAVAVGSSSDIRTVWVDGPEPVVISDGDYRLATEQEIEDSRNGFNKTIEVMEPLSRTFIPSKLEDNPYLKDTGYRAQINSMPEPLRSQLLHGDFLAGRIDDEWQVIPSEWVRQAQARWVGPPTGQMKAIGADIAQGGPDNTVLAAIHEGNHFDAMERHKGVDTPDGPSVAALVLKKRRDQAAIGVDTTGGWGGGTRSHLKENHNIDSIPIVFSAGGDGIDKATQLGYANLRAKMYWEFRLALSPDSGEDVILPPDPKVLAQLCASLWRPNKGKIQIESKEAIIARLLVSPDDADAIVIAWYIRHRAVLKKLSGTGKPKLSPPRRSGTNGWMGS